jgi:hypothetical protein
MGEFFSLIPLSTTSETGVRGSPPTLGFAGRPKFPYFLCKHFAGFSPAFYVDSLDLRLSSQLFQYFKRSNLSCSLF